jgi:Anti-sigma-K factor rskA
MPHSIALRLARSPEPKLTQMSAPGGLRERVLAGVRGETAISAGGLGGPKRRDALIACAISLLVGIGLGSLLVLAISSGGAPTVNKLPGMQASLHGSSSRAELVLMGMSEPPVGEVYELWVVATAGGGPRATDALFTVTSAGRGTVDVPGGLRGVREVMVTSEPLGGSTQPTGPVLVRVRAPAAR